ncbi:GntR family transcriptional regulator [Streptomyces carpinensis]|uniref:GntR family transcriptional regulator n=1 Tax=Streptomyces carpinensis TaxID=66369 RepID=UPI001AC0027B|nr:GntR family transcriptional regulator [Streptomyces carpinensis]
MPRNQETGHERIARALREAIASGELPVGASLPSEADLCAAHGTSRGPVRHALATLRAEGLIETRQGRPARVASPVLRQPMAGFTYFTRFARAAGRVPSARTLEIVRCRPEPREAAVLHVDEDTTVVRLLRLRLLDGLPTMLERSVFREGVGQLLFGVDVEHGSVTERLAAQGVDLGSVDQEIDAVAADAVDARHLDVSAGAPLLRQRRVAREPNGTAFEVADDRYRPDMVTFFVRDERPAAPPARRRRAARGTQGAEDGGGAPGPVDERSTGRRGGTGRSRAT